MAQSILVLFLGGTISASTVRDGHTTRLTGDQLVAATPGLADLDVDLEIQDIDRVASGSLTYGHVLRVVRTAAASSADGIVVVQGTDTLEETSWLADLYWADERPLVFTGAMRGPTLAGPDGPANLLAAVQLAASPQARGLGALLVLADEIHAARYVTKAHSTSIATFTSPNAGPLGRVAEGAVCLLTRVQRREPLPLPQALTARVPLYVATLDDDGTLLEGARDADGLVVAGFGVGHVPERAVEAIGALAARMPVVLTTRTGAGPVLRHTYVAPGSETDLLQRGLIHGGWLDPYKARLLLVALLAEGADRQRITAVFAQYP